MVPSWAFTTESLKAIFWSRRFCVRVWRTRTSSSPVSSMTDDLAGKTSRSRSFQGVAVALRVAVGAGGGVAVGVSGALMPRSLTDVLEVFSELEDGLHEKGTFSFLA